MAWKRIWNFCHHCHFYVKRIWSNSFDFFVNIIVSSPYYQLFHREYKICLPSSLSISSELSPYLYQLSHREYKRGYKRKYLLKVDFQYRLSSGTTKNIVVQIIQRIIVVNIHKYLCIFRYLSWKLLYKIKFLTQQLRSGCRCWERKRNLNKYHLFNKWVVTIWYIICLYMCY